MRRRKLLSWRGTLVLTAVLVVAGALGWKVWDAFGYVHLPSLAADAPSNSTILIPRSQLALHLDVRLRASHAETLAQARIELAAWKARLLERFDKDYEPELTSVTGGLWRNGLYFWDVIGNLSVEEAQQKYNERMQELFASKFGIVSEDLESTVERIVDYSKTSLDRHLGKFSNEVRSHPISQYADLVEIDAIRSNSFQVDPERGKVVGKIQAKRKLTHFLLSKLTKYYTSKGDVASLGTGIGQTCNLHPGVMTACQRALSISYTTAREILKRAGVRIATTSALAGPLRKSRGRRPDGLGGIQTRD